MTRLARYIAAFTVGAASSELTALLSIAAHLPVVTPGAMVAFGVSLLAMLLLTRPREKRPVEPERHAAEQRCADPCRGDR